MCPLFLWNKYFFIKTITELEKFSMGKHLLLEVYDVKYDLINDGIALEKVMVNGIKRAGMTILNVFQHFMSIEAKEERLSRNQTTWLDTNSSINFH